MTVKTPSTSNIISLIFGRSESRPRKSQNDSRGRFGFSFRISTRVKTKRELWKSIATEGRDHRRLDRRMKIESLIRTVIQIALPFDNPTTLRVSPKTLRVIEISKAASTFSQAYRKTIRRSRMFASQAPQTRFAKMQTLGIPRIRNIAPLSLQRTSNTQHPSR